MTGRAPRLLLVVAAAVGCAQPGTPPGGEVDRSPPRVVGVVPAAFDTLTDPKARVVIAFDERISERLQGVRGWEEAILVSPATSPLRVKPGRRTLEISLVRGWEPNRVYRIVVRPVFRDLFGNARVEPIDFVFSTGAPFPDAALAGFVSDRLTARPVAEARVEAVRRIDETRYVAVSDTAGFFAMPYLPAGAYDIRGWVDQNRDRIVDFFEIQDSMDVAFAVGDTTVVELGLLRPDTTPARLARAAPIDSLKVRLVFDDYFPPGPVEGEAWIRSLPDSALVGQGRLVHGSALDSILAAEKEAAAVRAEALAVADSLAAVQSEADSLRRAGEPVPERRQEERDRERQRQRTPVQARQPERSAAQIARDRVEQRRGDRGRTQAGKARLPSQELILLLPFLLEPDSAYLVTVEGVRNISGVPGGGGRARFVTPPPPPPPDTVAERPQERSPVDTVPPDTIPPDTIPPDTIPPDTIPPDTIPPDTIPPGPRAEPAPRQRGRLR